MYLNIQTILSLDSLLLKSMSCDICTVPFVAAVTLRELDRIVLSVILSPFYFWALTVIACSRWDLASKAYSCCYRSMCP